MKYSWSLSSSGEMAVLPYCSTLEWPFFCLDIRLSVCRQAPHSHHYLPCFPISSPYLLVQRGKGKWVGESTERGKEGKREGKRREKGSGKGNEDRG